MPKKPKMIKKLSKVNQKLSFSFVGKIVLPKNLFTNVILVNVNEFSPQIASFPSESTPCPLLPDLPIRHQKENHSRNVFWPLLWHAGWRPLAHPWWYTRPGLSNFEPLFGSPGCSIAEFEVLRLTWVSRFPRGASKAGLGGRGKKRIDWRKSPVREAFRVWPWIVKYPILVCKGRIWC